MWLNVLFSLEEFEDKKAELLGILGFSEGMFHIRYLGIALSTKRLSISDYDPLVTKLVGRIQSWTCKCLSYAGRLVLVQSVLMSIQRFSACTFYVLVIVLKRIQGILRNFLWTGNAVGKRNMVKWKVVCLHQTQDGLNIKEIYPGIKQL